MRIANGAAGMRVTLTQKDYDLLTDGGKNKSVSVVFNGLGNPEDFLEISKNDLPGGHRLNVTTGGKTTIRSGYPWVMSMAHRHFKKLDRLPFFGPEDVTITPHADHSIPGWYVSRPEMTRAYQKKTRRVKKEVQAAAPAKSSVVAATMSLKQAVQVINEHKADMGEDLLLEIDKATGRLRALMDLGS